MAIVEMDIKAADVMVRDVITVSPDMAVSELMEIFQNNSITGAPVIDGEGSLVGVISLADILQNDSSLNPGGLVFRSSNPNSDFCTLGDALQFDYMGGEYLESARDIHVKDIMKVHRFQVETDTPISEVARIMVENSLHRIIVMNQGRLAGIICTRDIVRLFVP